MLHLECKAPLFLRSSGCAAQHEQDGVYDSVSCTSWNRALWLLVMYSMKSCFMTPCHVQHENVLYDSVSCTAWKRACMHAGCVLFSNLHGVPGIQQQCVCVWYTARKKCLCNMWNRDVWIAAHFVKYMSHFAWRDGHDIMCGIKHRETNVVCSNAKRVVPRTHKH